MWLIGQDSFRGVLQLTPPIRPCARCSPLSLGCLRLPASTFNKSYGLCSSYKVARRRYLRVAAKKGKSTPAAPPPPKDDEEIAEEVAEAVTAAELADEVLEGARFKTSQLLAGHEVVTLFICCSQFLLRLLPRFPLLSP